VNELELPTLKDIEDIGEDELDKLKNIGITKIEDLIEDDAQVITSIIASFIGIDKKRIRKWIDQARALKRLRYKLKEPLVEKAPILRPSTDEMVTQLMNISMESNLAPESNIEEVAPPVSEPITEEVAPSTPKPMIREAKPRAPKSMIKKIAYRAPELKCPSCGGPTTKYQKLCEDCMRKHEREIVQSVFNCRKCGQSQVVVQKMKAIDLSLIATSAKCPKCGKSTQFILDSQKIGDWIDPLTQSFFRCGKCGSACRIVKTAAKNNIIQIVLYCGIDWIEIQKEIPVSIFHPLMIQMQKVTP
jgi:transcription elongation factor Elf1